MAVGKFAMAGLAIGAAYAALPVDRSDSSRIFAQPAATAIERIEAKKRVVNGTGLGSLTIENDGMDGGELLIRVSKAGEPASAKCRVAIRPVSPRDSRAEVDCAQSGAPDQAIRRLGSKALSIIVYEHVAATIEDRPYDIDRVADRMIALVAMNGPVIAASMPSSRE